MAEYRRIVSYLYKYTNGQKGENAGFVRVETRPDGIRLFFHVKDMRMMDERRVKAYFYFHEGEKKKGIFVDEFFCSRGFCEYKKVIPETAVNGFRELTDMDGMVFYDHNGLLYGTCWDDREITAEDIELSDVAAPEKEETSENADGAEYAQDAEYGKEEERAEETEYPEVTEDIERIEAAGSAGDTENRRIEEYEDISENMDKEENMEMGENTGTADDSRDINDKKTVKSMGDIEELENTADAETGVDVEIGPEASSAPIPAIEEEEPDGILKANEARAQPFGSGNRPCTVKCKKETEGGQETKNSRPPKNSPVSSMEQMLFEYPAVPIQWDSNLIQAVRMELQDISRLPTKNWRYAENGFLLQGYDIHHYLLLGRIQMRPEQYLWVLGVPGIYHNREKYLAEIFGFYDYIPMEQGKLKTGGFGFWIASLANG